MQRYLYWSYLQPPIPNLRNTAFTITLWSSSSIPFPRTTSKFPKRSFVVVQNKIFTRIKSSLQDFTSCFLEFGFHRIKILLSKFSLLLFGFWISQTKNSPLQDFTFCFFLDFGFHRIKISFQDFTFCFLDFGFHFV